MIVKVMPEKTQPDLLNTALAQLEAIVAELEFCENSAQSLTDFELEMINRESGADLTGFKNLSGLDVNITPKK